MYDMTIRLRADGKKRLYEQIYEHIRDEIREGRLLAGEKLPSTRFLAEYLQVSRSTVDCAYEQLLSEGYIESRPCRGYFVCRVEELYHLLGSGEKRGHWMAPAVSPEALTAGRAVSTERTGSAGRCGGAVEPACAEIDFSPNGVDMNGFPFGVWKKITKNILNDGNSELFAQGDPQGDLELRHTIGRYLHSSRGVNCRPDQIIVGAGNDYLLLLLEKILGPDVHMAMENPTYKRAYRIFRSFAYPIETVDMDESGMMVSELEKKEVTAAYVMPSHQFPTGTVMPIGRRMELLGWAAAQEGRYLIEDDYDSEFRYRGKPIPALQASDRQGSVIYIGTFSKAIAPAIRVSFLVLPERLLERYRRECDFYSSTVSRIDQRILNEFIRDGYFERHLNKMRKQYRAKHELLLELLAPFEKAFSITGENAGLHLVLTAKSGQREDWLVSSAAAQGVKVYGLSGSLVGEGPPGELPGTVLLGYGSMSQEQLREGMRRLTNAWL